MSSRLVSSRFHRWAEVDVRAIESNVGAVLERVPAGTRLIAVVKADGYGHGGLAAARATMGAGAWGLGVATVEEAELVQDLCLPERILVMGGLLPEDLPRAAKGGFAVTCSSHELLQGLRAVADPKRPLAVHLKVDTGMGRFGAQPEDASKLAREIADCPGLRLAGTWTHFAASESNEELTRRQFRRFLEVLDGLGVEPGLRHACNSRAALGYPEMALDAIRVGIALYGCEDEALQPALALRTVVTHVKTVPVGASVGYGAAWTASQPARVATAALGYADGVMRMRSDRGWALVRGRRAPLIGTVSMDAITLDVSEIPEVALGDRVTLIGSDGEDQIRAEQVAEWSGTISYEVLTSIGPRVVRRYLE